MLLPARRSKGLEDPGRLCKLPEHLMAHAQPWNPEVPALGVARHFARVLGDVNDNSMFKMCAVRKFLRMASRYILP